MFGSFLENFGKIMISLDGIVYSVVGWLYQIYIAISSARIFTDDKFELFRDRIYAILGVAMLFYLAYAILTGISDPDKLTSGESSVGKIVSNTVISLVLIAIVPTVFDFLYHAQQIVMTQNIIAKVILGSEATASEKLTISYNDADICKIFGESGSSCSKTYNYGRGATSIELAGNSIAVDIFSSFFYPYSKGNQSATGVNALFNELWHYNLLKPKKGAQQNVFDEVSNYIYCVNGDDASYIYGGAAEMCAIDGAVIYQEKGVDVEDRSISYKMVLQYAKTTGKFDGFALLANLLNDDKMVYTWGISTIAGGYIIYIFLSYCLDMGLRAAKLAFAQLVAPVPILARILPKQSSMFDSWVKFVGKSYFEVFTRIAIIFFGVFMVTNLPDLSLLWDSSILTSISMMSFKLPLIADIQASWGVLGFARVVVIIGILMFVKQAPDLMFEALGIKVSAGSLKIREKLRNMKGGEHMLNAAHKTRGTLTGAIGAGYMSALKAEKGQKFGSFFRGAVGGGRAGFRNGGGQFTAQMRRAYTGMTGDDTEVNIFGKPTIGERVNAKIDKIEKLNYENYDKMNEKIVQNREKIMEESFEKMIKRWEEKIKKVENSSEFQKVAAVRFNEQLAAYSRGAGAEYSARKSAFEGSEEYKKLKQTVTNQTLSKIYEEAARNGEVISDVEARKRATKKIEENMLTALKDSKTLAAKQYLDDMNNHKSQMAQIQQEAKKFAQTQMAAQDAGYKEALSKMPEDIETAKLDYMKKIKDEIISNPLTKEDKQYKKAVEQLNNKNKNKSDKDFDKYMKDMFNKYHKK